MRSTFDREWALPRFVATSEIRRRPSSPSMASHSTQGVRREQPARARTRQRQVAVSGSRRQCLRPGQGWPRSGPTKPVGSAGAAGRPAAQPRRFEPRWPIGQSTEPDRWCQATRRAEVSGRRCAAKPVGTKWPARIGEVPGFDFVARPGGAGLLDSARRRPVQPQQRRTKSLKLSACVCR